MDVANIRQNWEELIYEKEKKTVPYSKMEPQERLNAIVALSDQMCAPPKS